MLSQSLPHNTSLLPKPNLSLNPPTKTQSFPQFRHPHHSTRPKTRLYAATHDPSILSPHLHLHDNFYTLLGISETCGCGDIKRAYRDLARRLHPDVSPPGRAREFTEKFVLVQRAYETLSDPDRRAVYDRDVARGLRPRRRDEEAKYFRGQDFMHAPVGRRPSWAWRSIVKGRNVLDLGCYWSVHPNSSLNASRDRWLPKAWSFRPIFCSDSSIEVKDLVLSGSSWNVDIILRTFDYPSAVLICGLPINPLQSADTLTWTHTSSGIYTVNSGYKTIANAFKEGYWDGKDSGSTSYSSSSNDKIWKSIWTCNLPPRVKHFLWRAANGSLAFPENLEKRHIPLLESKGAICPLCFSSDASEIHTFWKCPFSLAAWRLAGYYSEELLVAKPFLDKWRLFVNSDRFGSLLEPIACLLWLIWKSRHEAIFEGIKPSPVGVVCRASSLLNHFLASSCPTNHSSDWEPPPVNVIKLNCDAAWQDGMGAGGWILRDYAASCILVGHSARFFACSPLLAEGFACLFGMRSAIGLGLSSVLVELDCLELINAINSPSPCSGQLRWIVSSILQAANSFLHISFQFRPKNCNKAAHVVARLGWDSNAEESWTASFPPGLISQLI